MKFWRTPELVEKLLPYLNLESTLALAQSHGMTRSLLQGTSIWNKLIRRSCPFAVKVQPSDLPNPDLRLSIPPEMQVKIGVMKNLVEILKLMGDPQEALLLDLLDVICERFATDDAFMQNLDHTHVSMGCSRHPAGHLIPLSGFLLLEEVEAAFGTTLQSLESVKGGALIGQVQLAVSSRISRQKGQQGKTTTLSNIEFEVKSKESVNSFKSLMQLRPELSPPMDLEVWESIGTEGWETLAEALKFQPNVVRRLSVESAALKEGTKKDLRNIWDALEQIGFVEVLCKVWDYGGYLGMVERDRVDKQNGEEAWMELEEILNDINHDDEEEEDSYDSEEEEEKGPFHHN